MTSGRLLRETAPPRISLRGRFRFTNRGRPDGRREGVEVIWMGIGLGFGPSDLAAVRVGQIDKQTYDLRRGKTGIERFGDTPPFVWSLI